MEIIWRKQSGETNSFIICQCNPLLRSNQKVILLPRDFQLKYYLLPADSSMRLLIIFLIALIPRLNIFILKTSLSFSVTKSNESAQIILLFMKLNIIRYSHLPPLPYPLLLFGIVDSILQSIYSCLASLLILSLTSHWTRVKNQFLFRGSYRLIIENKSRDYTHICSILYIASITSCYVIVDRALVFFFLKCTLDASNLLSLVSFRFLSHFMVINYLLFSIPTYLTS